jgi:large subunit ribosomal protein L18
MRKSKYALPFRRKEQGRTNYKKRLSLLKSKQSRLVVRKSNKHILAQLIEYGGSGDKILITVHSRELKKYGWNYGCSNLSAAYLTGLLIGVKKKGKKAVLDIGLQSPIAGSRLFAALKGAVDGGLKITFSEKVFPNEDRISGKHISTYANLLKNKDKYKKVFSGYLKSKKEPEKIHEVFLKTKEKILAIKNG